MIQLSTGVVFLMASMYGTQNPSLSATAANSVKTQAPEQAENVIMQDRKTVIAYLREKYADTPILIDIARCESTFAQYDKDGQVIRGKANPSDVGVMQINEKFHAEKAKELGYDLYTIEGNVNYAKYLYQNEGAAPWKSSSKCWGTKDLTMN